MYEKAVIVKSKTKLDLITEQYNTLSQAKFAIERQREIVEQNDEFLGREMQNVWQSNRGKRKQMKGSGELSDFREEHEQYGSVLERVQNTVSRYMKSKVIESSFLPSYLFAEQDLVIVIGQDGLVANTAKYAKNLPIIAINPDTSRFDGQLLPFTIETFERAFNLIQSGRCPYQHITMAEAVLNDGQRLLAFNDFFIGTASHTSARYLITHAGETETHSSSGIIVSTGAGATGWLSSIFNMMDGLKRAFGEAEKEIWGSKISASPAYPRPTLGREEAKLAFVVREPFLSKTSQASLVGGYITPENQLVVESLMPKTGVIFSDGIETDRLRFNSGSIARIGIAQERAKLVVH